jgi:hypothetical protein
MIAAVRRSQQRVDNEYDELDMQLTATQSSMAAYETVCRYEQGSSSIISRHSRFP